MWITSGISIRNDVYYNHLDTRYSMNYWLQIAAGEDYGESAGYRYDKNRIIAGRL